MEEEKVYTITITEILSKDIQVKTKNIHKAKELVKKMYIEGDIQLNYLNYKGYDIYPHLENEIIEEKDYPQLEEEEEV